MTTPQWSTTQTAAFRAGRDAYLAGVDSATCPYPGGQDDPEGLRQLWIGGFVRARQATGAAPPQLPADDTAAG